MTMTTEATSIYHAIGGRAALVAAVDDFYVRLLVRSRTRPVFPGGVGVRHRAYLVTVLGEALGGPERYRGPDLARAHGGLGITDAQFDRTAAHLSATLDGLGVPRHLAEDIIAIVATLRPGVVNWLLVRRTRRVRAGQIVLACHPGQPDLLKTHAAPP
jgi:hemoglobin